MGRVLFCAICAMCVLPAAGYACYDLGYSYDFRVFNDSGNFITIPGLDIKLQVDQAGSNATFKIINNSMIASSVCDIYFEGDDLPAVNSLNWGSQKQVKFSMGASPKELPGGNNLAPKFSTNKPSSLYSLDSDSPVSENGVGPGEWLDIGFKLSDFSYSQLIYKLNHSQIRVGLHIQAFSDGSSKPAVNTAPGTPDNVPEPATLGLLGFGAAFWFKFRKRR